MNNIAIWNDLFLVKSKNYQRDVEISSLFAKSAEKEKRIFVQEEETISFRNCVINSILPDDAVLLVGTRPTRLFASILSPFQYMSIQTKRYKSDSGKEKRVEIIAEDKDRLKRWLCRITKTCKRIVVLEDAIVEGGTIDIVLRHIWKEWHEIVQIWAFFAVDTVKDALLNKYPNCHIKSKYYLTGEPIRDCTVLFLSDLLNEETGTHKRFIDDYQLLVPCFHDDYEYIRDNLLDIIDRYQDTTLLIDVENKKAGYFYLLKQLLAALRTVQESVQIQIRFGKNSWYHSPTIDIYDAIFKQQTYGVIPQKIIQTEKTNIEDLKYGDYDQNSIDNKTLATIWRNYLILQEPVRERLVADVLGLNGGELMLAGCHIRMGFKQAFYGHPNAVPLEEYFNEIQKALDSGYRKMFIASDSQWAINKAVERFGEQVVFFPCLRASNDTQPIEYYLEQDNIHGLENLYYAYRDMFTLSTCEYLICGRSNLSYMTVIHKLSRGERFKTIQLIDHGICKGGIFWEEYIRNGWNYRSHEWLFVSDLDDKLLNEGRLDEETRQGLQEISNVHIPFTVATGRSVFGMRKALGGILPYLPTIHYSGAMIWDNNYQTTLQIFPFQVEELQFLLQQIIKRGNDFMVIGCRDGKDCAYVLSEQIAERIKKRFANIPSDLLPIKTNCSWLVENVETIAVYEYSDDHSPAYGNWKSFSMKDGWQYISIRAGKREAVQKLMQLFQFRKLAAFGNGENDEGLLLAAEYSCVRQGSNICATETFQDCAEVPVAIRKIWENTR